MLRRPSIPLHGDALPFVDGRAGADARVSDRQRDGPGRNGAGLQAPGVADPRRPVSSRERGERMGARAAEKLPATGRALLRARLTKSDRLTDFRLFLTRSSYVPWGTDDADAQAT